MRLGVVVLGFGLLAPLAVACRLEPDPQGYGTHQQLGLPPCSAVVLFGRPCPTCGMTTAWSAVVRGRWIDAVRANAGGTVLCWLDLVAVPWLWLSAARGRWLGWAPRVAAAVWLSVGVALITLLQWVAKLLA